VNGINAWVNWLAWVGVIGWIYWLTNRVQQLLNYAEQLLGACQRLLAATPGKSAPRAAGPDDVPAERRFLGVRMTPDRPTPTPRTEPITAAIDVGLDRIFAAEPPRRRHAAPTNRKDHRP
jgi:hypothetical protein